MNDVYEPRMFYWFYVAMQVLCIGAGLARAYHGQWVWFGASILLSIVCYFKSEQFKEQTQRRVH